MRSAFLKSITQLAADNRQVFLVTADTGFKVFDQFQKDFPDQYLNAGISEQAIIGLAAGLAANGKRPFVYGIIPFVTLRCLDQIRNDLCLHRLPVTIVGVGAGLSYGAEGATHHAVEDIAVMSALPEMRVICPGDPVEVDRAVYALQDVEGPTYIRLGKSGEPNIHEGGLPSFQIGKAAWIRDGRDIGIFATGNMLETATHVADQMKEENVSVALASMHTIKPIDVEAINDMASRVSLIVTIEEHCVIGGLGSNVASVLAGKASHPALVQISFPDQYCDVIGDQQYLRSHYDLTPDMIAAKLLAALNRY